MDTDTAQTSPGMPRSKPFEPARADLSSGAPTSTIPNQGMSKQGVSNHGVPATVSSTENDRGDRAGVFGHLVKDDGDIAGLVAYSIYKQNKLDWLRAFEQAKGRAPEENELASYIIGEGTPRRLATYRHLAEATLAGNGPEVDGAPVSTSRPQLAGRRFGRSGGEALATGMLALYGIIAVLFILGFYLAMHYTGARR